jgi:hypothetical protein
VRLTPARPWLTAAALYLAITLPFVSPVINYRHLSDASYEGDSRLLIWTLAWDAHAILSGTPLTEANIFYPLPNALSQAEHHIGLGIFALPFYAATSNPVLTYWIVWLLSFPLNALAMHALAWRVTRDHVASFVGGLVYAFCFFRMHHAHGHIQLLWTWALPLVPLALERWLARPTWGRMAIVAALVIVQALSSWYLAVFVTLLGIVAAFALVPGMSLRRAHVAQATVGLAMGGAVVTWFAKPYLGLAAGPLEEAAGNAADLAAYLVPPEQTWLGQWCRRSTSLAPRWIWGEQTLYVGMTTLGLALVGIWRVRHTPVDRVCAAVVMTGLLALALSFGPSGAGITPFDLFSSLPGMALMRAPARFALLVMMALALLASVGLAAPERRVSPIAALLAAAILFESFVVYFPSGKPQPLRIPAAYEQLATLPDGAVLSLPTYRATPEAFRETDYLLFSTAHWKPIVNGFGRQEPPAHAAMMEVLGRFPDYEAVELMRRIGIRYVVLHTRRAAELANRVIRAGTTKFTRVISSTDGDYVYEIAP